MNTWRLLTARLSETSPRHRHRMLRLVTPETSGASTMKKRIATIVFAWTSLLVLAVQPALAGTAYMPG